VGARLDDIASRLAAGERLTDADAEALLATPDLVTLGMLADEARRRRHGRRTTFVRVFEIDASAVGEPLAVPDAAGEVRLVGTPAGVEPVLALARRAVTAAAGRPVSALTLYDLDALAAAAAVPLADLAARLHDAGIESVADVAVDRTADAAGAVRAVRHGGLEALRLTVHRGATGAPLGILGRVAALQREVGGFRSFAPLARDVDPDEQPSTGYDDVRLVALARLLVDNIESIQVDWPVYGPKLAQVALTFGADDVDRVSPFDTMELGARRAPLEEIRRNVIAAALEPVQRDGRFALFAA